MFIVISDNCESYSDHRHANVLVCETEDEAKEAVRLLRGWMRRASVVISEAWVAFDNRPNRENETNVSYDDGSGYCLDWDRYARDFEPLPIDIHTGCFPDNPGYSEPMPEEYIERAIDYMEVPKWARSLK